jgi:hypothetical protein
MSSCTATIPSLSLRLAASRQQLMNVGKWNMETEWETATIRERGGDQKEFSTMIMQYIAIL